MQEASALEGDACCSASIKGILGLGRCTLEQISTYIANDASVWARYEDKRDHSAAAVASDGAPDDLPERVSQAQSNSCLPRTPQSASEALRASALASRPFLCAAASKY